MNREQISDFLEAYRDGVIDENAAAELARTVREGGRDADWVVEELAFTGWIQQALQELDEEGFVRSFLQRLYAERGEDEFTQAFTQRLAVETQKIKRQELQESRLRMPFRKFLGSDSVADPAGGRNRTATRMFARPAFLLVVLCLAVIGGGSYFLLLASARPQVAGTILEASPGVTVLARETRREASPGGEVAENETVSVPVNGHAVVSDQGNTRWQLGGGAMATFMARAGDGDPPADAGNRGVLLMTGVLKGELGNLDKGLTHVTTPHATAELAEGVTFTLSVTAGSTYVEVDSGALVLTRRSDGRSLKLTGGQYVVAAPGADFEPLEK
jgi:hypothetical protein